MAEPQSKEMDALMNKAVQFSLKSIDPSTKVGAFFMTDEGEIKVGGYNSFPSRVFTNIPARQERPQKYDWVVHAEANVITGMAKFGGATLNGIMVSTQMPCSQCMGLIIQAGIQHVICPDVSQLKDKWRLNAEITMQMAQESGVYITIARIPEEQRIILIS